MNRRWDPTLLVHTISPHEKLERDNCIAFGTQWVLNKCFPDEIPNFRKEKAETTGARLSDVITKLIGVRAQLPGPLAKVPFHHIDHRPSSSASYFPALPCVVQIAHSNSKNIF